MTAPLRLDIDLGALAANWRWFRDRVVDADVGAAVKADAYGLGSGPVVATLAAAGCREFYVATWAEAAALGALPADTRLAVLHGVTAADARLARALPGCRPVLNTRAQAALWRASGSGPCDAMVDTGMNRLGFDARDLDALNGLPVDTLHSHLACADAAEHTMNARQLMAFAALPGARKALANSDGVLLGAAYHLDAVRPGLGLYGGVAGTRPVVRPHARVLQVRSIPVGATVGYGATWTAVRDSRIAVVNLGYADGYARALQAAGTAMDGAARLVGRVSMDLTAWDVTGLDVTEGDWLPIDFDLAALSGPSGISRYELLTGLGSRYERRYA